jgi:hypothetical protein
MYDPAPNRPTWTVPILFGASATFVLTGLLTFMMSTPNAGVRLTACCCCGAAFIPYGLIPALVAMRRDPTLTTAQGFAVSFIAVGIGMVVWAGMIVLSGETPSVDPAVLRQQLVDYQKDLPEDQKSTAEELDAMVDFTIGLLPYVPVIVATGMTLLAGLAGMLFTSITRPRLPT